jgi:ElaB/YqjD/DUF883 family membrane-anchored ribosome-binding protein
METTGQPDSLRDRLLDDLRLVVKDAEDLFRNTGKQANEGYRLARAKLETTGRYVQENPWQAIGMSALAGLMVGLWLGRR